VERERTGSSLEACQSKEELDNTMKIEETEGRDALGVATRVIGRVIEIFG
jgi:hypothetical protein